jgi:hypothetical protein
MLRQSEAVATTILCAVHVSALLFLLFLPAYYLENIILLITYTRSVLLVIPTCNMFHHADLSMGIYQKNRHAGYVGSFTAAILQLPHVCCRPHLGKKHDYDVCPKERQLHAGILKYLHHEQGRSRGHSVWVHSLIN